MIRPETQAFVDSIPQGLGETAARQHTITRFAFDIELLDFK